MSIVVLHRVGGDVINAVTSSPRQVMASQTSVSRARRSYERWHQGLEVDEYSAAPWHQLVKRHVDKVRHLGGKRVLEIASGRGGFACWLAGCSPSPAFLAAADFARAAVSKAQAYARSRGMVMHWEVADIQAICHADAVFDTVFCCETLEHVPNPVEGLEEIARVLVPGGYLYLTTPNYLGPMGLYRLYARVRGRPFSEGGQPLSRALLLPATLKWVRSVGLRIVTVAATGHYLPMPGRAPVRIDWLERVGWITRWFALHSLVVATKPT